MVEATSFSVSRTTSLPLRLQSCDPKQVVGDPYQIHHKPGFGSPDEVGFSESTRDLYPAEDFLYALLGVLAHGIASIACGPYAEFRSGAVPDSGNARRNVAFLEPLDERFIVLPFVDAGRTHILAHLGTAIEQGHRRPGFAGGTA